MNIFTLIIVTQAMCLPQRHKKTILKSQLLIIDSFQNFLERTQLEKDTLVLKNPLLKMILK
jgi:hypothetical protein